MEEKKVALNANVNNLRALASGELEEFLKQVKEVKQGVADITKTLADREQAVKLARKEEKERQKLEEQAQKDKERVEVQVEAETQKVDNEKVSDKQTAEPEVVEPKITETVKEAVEAKNEETVAIKTEAAEIVADKESEKQEAEKAPQKKEFVPRDDRREQRVQNPLPERPHGQVGQVYQGRGQGYQGNRPQGQGYQGNRPYQDRNQNGGQGGQGYQGNRPQGQGYQGNRPYQDRNQNGGQGGQGYQGQGYQGNRPQGGAQNGPRQQRPAAPTRPFGAGGPRAPRPQELTFVPRETKAFAPKKKTGDKSYEDKHVPNKKQLAKVNVNIGDFDEDKSGYRKLRIKKGSKGKNEQAIVIEKATINKELIPLKELSEKIGISAVEITKMLFKEGIIKTINDSIDYDVAAFVAANLNIELELKLDKTAEDVLSEGYSDEADDANDLKPRPPIVTVMGHVDHGKTSLLDRIRSTNVTAGEAGGITQHIGAYSVNLKGNIITFLDTPGHAAFTAMRARGAQVTDIAVIVIAADDGIMPQTVEAINHARAAKVSIIIAANKIDKPQANIDKVRQQLADQNILVEEWGGDIMLVPVSAKTGEGVDNLLESILTIAEVKELRANPNRKARGAIIEAKLDKGKGPVASVVVQNGTLRAGDNVVAGTSVGKIRAMFDDKGRMVKEAGPSMAVSILGLESVPNAGDVIFAVDQEKLSKLVAAERKNKEREDMIRQSQKVTLDELFSKISDGDLKTLNLIIKADVQGSVEAVKQSLEELTNEEVKVTVLHAAVGAINETDVMLADSSNSIIIGFNVRPDANARVLAERSKVDIKLYRIIYEAIEDIQKAMKGMLSPKFNDVYLGKAEVRETFKITGVGTVAGCYVTDGKIVRSGKLRIYRNDVMICEGNVKQLKRFKDDVKEVAQGFECGISIEDFTDVKIGDFIESYIVEEKA